MSETVVAEDTGNEIFEGVPGVALVNSCITCNCCADVKPVEL